MTKKHNYKLVLPIVIISITVLFSQNNEDSLIAHYKLSKEYFDNQVEGKFYDLSGNGNHATPSDTFQFVEDHLGNPESAMRFDGIDDYLDCGDSRVFNFPNGVYSIVAWINPNISGFNLNQDDKYHSLFGKNNGGNKGYAFSFDPYGKFHFFEHAEKYNAVMDKKANNFVNGYWQLIVIVIDQKDKNLKIYRNGYLEYNISTNFKELSNSGNFIIGPDAIDNTFKGAIEYFKIYKRGVTVSEMDEIINDKIPHRLFWDFEKGYISQENYFPLRYSDSYNPHNTEIYKYGDGEIIPYSGRYCAKHTCSSGKYRAEIAEAGGGDTTLTGINKYQVDGEERWFSFYVLFPEDFSWEEENKNWLAVTQFFEAQTHNANSPTYVLQALESGFRFESTLWAKDSNGEIAHQAYFRDRSKDIPIKKNHWHKVVYHVKLSTDSSEGFFEGWVDGIPLLAESGNYTYTGKFEDRSDGDDHGRTYTYRIRNHRLIGRNLKVEDKRGIAFKIGYYRGKSGDNSVKQSIYTDDIKIGKTAKSVGFDHKKKADERKAKLQIHIPN